MVSFADFWDDISDDPDARKRANKVIRFINKYNPKAKVVLELGVGNGAVLANFPKKYALSGLDVDKSYVELARKKLPKSDLFTASMHNFRKKQKYDVIFSIFDSINFLTSFQQWKQTFTNVQMHLKPNGIFVFDMYTPLMLKTARNWLKCYKEKFGFVVDEGIVKANNLTWHYQLYVKVKDDDYIKHVFDFT
ncbi:class I SAM-dependent methyltransferase, partial [Candidatus Woesearchaeota archaeon]|nr:class I SAM-dependent methyltransferase [Candidatus Woesearchaeota archaeon]